LRSITTETAPGTASPSAEHELRTFFDAFADDEPRWRRRNRFYHRLVAQIMRFHVAPGRSVLEIGCGGGDVLAAVEPSEGLGVDLSPRMVDLARRQHPELTFEVAAGERYRAGRQFDYVLLSDVVPYASDLLALFDLAREHCHADSRIVVHSYSRVWRPVIRIAELLHLKPRKPLRNWVSAGDVENLLYLSDFEVVQVDWRILLPKRIPLVTAFANGVLANVWPFRHLCLSYWIVARPRPQPLGELSVSVICPCRNEEGHIPALVERLPEIGSETELVFVEGGSRDDTRGAIERAIVEHPERDIRLVEQPGAGKGDAVRAGFAAAKHDVLMILDGDLSVAPEDLPKFYRALVEGHGELVNGSRLVYDMEPGSMQRLNVVGNKLFSLIFEQITGQRAKDTLCGTKVLRRGHYERIAAARSYFGDFDPFGDFDLLYGAARLGLRIVDLPVRYGTRTYGTTNISRFRHGLLLFRMAVFAYWKFRVRPSSSR
jgi:SAM-dependent methyltransferase